VRAAPPPAPPVYERPETHPFLREAKAKVLRGLSFRYQSVFRQRDLALWFASIGREGDALPILEHAYSSVKFRGKYDVWYAAATACCVAAHHRHKASRLEGADPELRRFIDQPAHALVTQPDIWTTTFVRSHVAGERGRFGRSFDDPDPDVALEAMAWWAATLIFFHEMALAGFPRRGKLNLKRLGSWIKDAFARIRGKLEELVEDNRP
jgi:hypothetical protein